MRSFFLNSEENEPTVTVAREYVVLPRQSARRMSVRNRLLRRTIADLHTQLADEKALLISALHELAIVQGKEPRHFTRRWLAAKRKRR